LVARHRSVLEALGLPTRYDGDWTSLREAMNLDKKTRGSNLRFVVLDDLARPRILRDPDEAMLAEAYRRTRG
jgi:3-dehydroquinate synthase